MTLRPFLPADIPAARILWQSTPGVGLSAADEPAALTAFLAREYRFEKDVSLRANLAVNGAREALGATSKLGPVVYSDTGAGVSTVHGWRSSDVGWSRQENRLPESVSSSLECGSYAVLRSYRTATPR